MKKFDQWYQAVSDISQAARESALLRQQQLTKPPGALGELEAIAVDFSGWQGLEKPSLERISLCVFAADHGVMEEGVSAFPQAVTAEMIRNFSHGGAAVSVLARHNELDFKVINLGTVTPLEKLANVDDQQLSLGSGNFCQQAAMDEELLQACLNIGARSVDGDCQLFIGGEMGIGNTSSAAALLSAILSIPPARSVGRGTGIDNEGLKRKQAVVQAGLDLHVAADRSPLEYLRRLGGLEIAALVGAYISAAQKGVPCLIDGFISSAAALVACKMNPGVRNWILFAHCSAESGHQLLLDALEAKPLVNFSMRLGEGSGAALVVPLLRSALSLHKEMATFDEAAVSNKQA